MDQRVEHVVFTLPFMPHSSPASATCVDLVRRNDKHMPWKDSATLRLFAIKYSPAVSRFALRDHHHHCLAIGNSEHKSFFPMASVQRHWLHPLLRQISTRYCKTLSFPAPTNPVSKLRWTVCSYRLQCACCKVCVCSSQKLPHGQWHRHSKWDHWFHVVAEQMVCLHIVAQTEDAGLMFGWTL